MDAFDAVSVVIRSRAGRYKIYTKETSEYRSAISEGGSIVREGTDSYCQSFQSPGQIFREHHGYSKTMKKNMKRNALDVNRFSDSINAYRAIRKLRKKDQKLEGKAKRDRARAGRKEKKAKVQGKKSAATAVATK